MKNNSKNLLIIRGARVNNLKNVSLEIPRNSLTVITGVSGSGKSSLAFDTIYAEGQRRYVESLSAYARQFLERMNKPDVDFIQGIAPAIAIEQKTTTRNPRSTVGTTTEIYDYLRLLFARVGKTYCVHDGQHVQRDSVRTVMERLETLTDSSKLYVLFPMHAHEGHSLQEELENLRKGGFVRIVVRGEIINLEDDTPVDCAKEDIRVLVDRLIWKKEDDHGRFSDSIQTAFYEGDGYVRIYLLEQQEEWKFSDKFECSECHTRYLEPEPRLFSFNNPAGACPTCQGFGRTIGIDMNLVVPNVNKTLEEGAIQPWTTPKFSKYYRDLARIASSEGIPLDQPYRALTKAQKDFLFNGRKGFPGIKGFFKMLEDNSYKMHYRILMARYRGYTTCETCEGSRLRPEANAIKIADRSLYHLVQMTIVEMASFFTTISFTEYERNIAQRILEEIQKRLKYLNEVGLGYLTLDRLSHTLSGGEAQRINLATSLGSALVGSLYVLDEPSIGLHPRDNDKLITILHELRNIGNTVLVVEHDADMMRAADVIVDMGPQAGEHGGEIVAVASPSEILTHKDSLTGMYLSKKKSIPIPRKRRKPTAAKLVIKEPSQHNLKGMDITIPLGLFVCVTGVSGSGKSTLVQDILYAGLKKEIEGMYEDEIGAFSGFKGSKAIKHVEFVDQSPIGRTPRSNPVTYIKTFDVIRDLFASTAMAKVRGYEPGYFSFNVPGGRCDTCEGDGFVKIEMQFLADLYLECESCKGTRYKKETLDVLYNGKNIVEILNMTVTEALHFFESVPRVANKLRVLLDVGLGYMKLGQPATTLSGGEAQRMKLALHLSAKTDEHTLFIFDEPTTGLHFDDIQKLLKCFQALIEQGHSVLIIEHNLDVIKCADHIIDLGPEGGNAGGYVVATGSPEQIIEEKKSYTAKYLRRVLQGG